MVTASKDSKLVRERAGVRLLDLRNDEYRRRRQQYRKKFFHTDYLHYHAMLSAHETLRQS